MVGVCLEEATGKKCQLWVSHIHAAWLHFAAITHTQTGHFQRTQAYFSRLQGPQLCLLLQAVPNTPTLRWNSEDSDTSSPGNLSHPGDQGWRARYQSQKPFCFFSSSLMARGRGATRGNLENNLAIHVHPTKG